MSSFLRRKLFRGFSNKVAKIQRLLQENANCCKLMTATAVPCVNTMLFCCFLSTDMQKLVFPIINKRQS